MGSSLFVGVGEASQAAIVRANTETLNLENIWLFRKILLSDRSLTQLRPVAYRRGQKLKAREPVSARSYARLRAICGLPYRAAVWTAGDSVRKKKLVRISRSAAMESAALTAVRRCDPFSIPFEYQDPRALTLLITHLSCLGTWGSESCPGR